MNIMWGDDSDVKIEICNYFQLVIFKSKNFVTT